MAAGLVRVSIPRVPEPVMCEVVANALVHGDYTQMGAVQVQLSEDALEVTSPGGFLAGVRLDNLLIMQRPRSPLLADAFKRAVRAGAPDADLPGSTGLQQAATSVALRATLRGVQAAVPPLREGPHLRAARERLAQPPPGDRCRE